MTINVAVKCPEGIVLGADSLISVTRPTTQPPELVAHVSGAKKLFSLGALPAGVLLNGGTMINGETIDDILVQFIEEPIDINPGQFRLRETVEKLASFVTAKIGESAGIALQLIVGGYSRGHPQPRYGELYTIDWPGGQINDPYSGDKSFGVVIGGQLDSVYRWLFGFDLTEIHSINQQFWNEQYERTREYIFQAVEAEGGAIPERVKGLPLPPWSSVPPWYALSTYDMAEDLRQRGSTPTYQEMLVKIVKQSRFPYVPMSGFFSLEMAVNFAWHMLLLAYVESNFTLRMPVVGSYLRIAVVTRNEGLKQVWRSVPTLPPNL